MKKLAESQFGHPLPQSRIYTVKDSEMNTDEVDHSVTANSSEEDEHVVSMNPYHNLRSLRKALKSKRFVKMHEQLYYHLKHKFHMSVRNQTTYFQMRMEARNYMLKLGRDCNTALDYKIFTGALDAAFLVSEEEIRSREAMKDRRNLVQMKKINQFNNGDLGNLDRRGLTAFLPREGRPSRMSRILAEGKRVTFSDIPDIRY